VSTFYSFEDDDGIVREKRTISPNPGSGGPPSGPAGGSLNGTYPNPGIANGAVALLQLASSLKPTGSAGPTDLAVRAIGVNADEGCAGNDARLSDSRAPTGLAGGDLAGSYPGPTIGAGKVAATQVSGTLKPSGTASPSTEALRALGTTGDTACAGNDGRLARSIDAIAVALPTAADWSNNSHKITSLANGAGAQDAAAFGQIPTALPPNGSAGGDLTGTYPTPTLATAGGGAAGPIGDSTHVAAVTVDAKGRVTALSSIAIAGGGGVTEVSYTEWTSDVAITATTAATANTVVTAPAHSFDGSTLVIIEFYCPKLYSPGGATGRATFIELYQDGSDIGQLGANYSGADSLNIVPVMVRRRMTPASGSRTYSIRCFVTAGTGHAEAGAGGAGNIMPGYIRILTGA
jgi:hypothetical protein